MSKSSTWLLDFARDEFSQQGEDGVIEKILDVIPEHDNWCVEFGAWDGIHLTNTRYLIESRGYSGVLVEANPQKYRDLQRNYDGRSHVHTMNQFVGFEKNDNLDHLLSSTPIPQEFDLLSIDIDGNDYHVWSAMSKYRPKVVVIEFNPTIPTPVRFVQTADPSVSQGASLLSLVELGKEKGYELVSVLPWNALFVQKEYYPLFEIESNAPEVLRTDSDQVTYLFSGYDGKILLSGSCWMPWHGIDLKKSKIQQLPWFLRSFPDDYTSVQRIAFQAFLFATRPIKTSKTLIRTLKALIRERRVSPRIASTASDVSGVAASGRHS